MQTVTTVLQCVISIQFIQHVLATWQVSQHSLSDSGLAAGVYNDSVYLIGGYNNTRKVMEFQWKTDTLSTIAPDELDIDVYGTGQYWSQLRDIVYLIVPTATTIPNPIATYNLATNEFTSSIATTAISVMVWGCLASQYQHLYVVGGYNDNDKSLNQVQIFNVATLQWTNGPLMNDARDSLACVVSNDYLWAFGGFTTQLNTFLITNERIHINTNIMQNSWNYVDSLILPTVGLRCISWNDIVYILGGGKSWTDGYLDIMYLMNAKTGVISVDTDSMPYPNAASAPIIAGTILYVFDGWRHPDTGNLLNDSFYFFLPTNDPTTFPSKSPFDSPTHHPSVSPTNIPSKYPTEDPSTSPIHYPSVSPTGQPSHPTLRADIPRLSKFISSTSVTHEESSPETTHSTESAEDMTVKSSLSVVVMWMIGSSVVIVCIIAVLILLIYRMIRKRRKVEVVAQMERMSSPSSVVHKVVSRAPNANVKRIETTDGVNSNTGGNRVINVELVMQGSAKVTQGRERNDSNDSASSTSDGLWEVQATKQEEVQTTKGAK